MLICLNQPILNVLAAAFHASARAMGAVVTVTQIGFGCGIVFLVPLGDVIAKKRLILAIYVGGLFGFFALGSFAATWTFTAAGWAGVCLLCLASCVVSALFHGALSARWRRSLPA